MHYSLTESPERCKRVRIRLLKQASELHIGLVLFTRNYVTGAPVIELKYKHLVHAVLEKALMATLV